MKFVKVPPEEQEGEFVYKLYLNHEDLKKISDFIQIRPDKLISGDALNGVEVLSLSTTSQNLHRI
jgi:hypothetical protein